MDINPILSEIQGLSPAAQAALGMAGHTLANTAPPPSLASQVAKPDNTPAPNMSPMKMPGSDPIPTLGGPSMPNVSGPSQTDLDAARRSKLLADGSGESQIMHRIEGTGFGQKHPLLGKIVGGAAQGVATLGDIGLSAVAPSLAINLPGTEYHHDMLLNHASRAVTQDEANAKDEAQTAADTATAQHTAGETANQPQAFADAHEQSVAATAEHNAQVSALLHPQAKTDFEAWQQQYPGRPIEEWLKLQSDAKPQEAPKTIQVEVNGKPHQMAWNPATQKYDKDQGESGEKPPTVNVNAGREGKMDVLTAYKPAMDSAERMNVMTDNYEKAIKNHDQQAMLSLLANHLGMTMGREKGMRINQATISEAQKSQPWLQGMEAHFDKDGYLSGVTLSPTQMRQMVGLGQKRYSEDVKKARATAQYLGAQDDGPERVAGPSTIRYYVGLANGDAAKAKQMATEDGWTVK